METPPSDREKDDPTSNSKSVLPQDATAEYHMKKLTELAVMNQNMLK